MRLLLIPLFLALLAFSVAAQDGDTQVRSGTIRGIVRNQVTGQPVIGARVAVQGTTLGARTTADGSFRIERVPVGHRRIVISAHGYSTSSVEVLVSSARQSVVDIHLEEYRVTGDSIVVQGSPGARPINTVAAVSVTPFSIVDVNRYAAAFKDPSRMVTNFAGVLGRGTTNNYIVVRGGSPIELLWRLDGIEIPNPNHFGKSGSTGGLISAINSAGLGNSDFFTGAFPAEYGTKLSAVFDLHSRAGNDERFESRVEASFNGLEAVSEGPLGLGERSSYLFTYRHSTLSVLREVGILDYTNLPDFDDASLRLSLPLGSNDKLDVTTLWGDARVNVNNTSNEEIGSGSGILVAGAQWQHIYNESWLQRIYVNRVVNSFSEAYDGDDAPTTLTQTTARGKWSFSVNAQHLVEFGGAIQDMRLSLENVGGSGFDTTINSTFSQGFVNWNWKPVESFTLNVGVFGQGISYNSSESYEPRASLTWSPSESHSLTLGFGVHRQPQPLEFTHARHWVLGYQFRPLEELVIKAEAYLKTYSDVPIHASRRDAFSFLNEGFAKTLQIEDLVNAGEGRTYGAELTVLKQYRNGYFITATASLVRQEFVGSDGVWHFGAFDNRYILNLVSGLDIELSPTTTLTLGEKFTIAGGGMYTPYDYEASRLRNTSVYDSSRTFGVRAEDYVRLDANIDLRFNWERTALTIYGSALNVLDVENVMYRFLRWDGRGIPRDHFEYDLPIIPVLGIRFEF